MFSYLSSQLESGAAAVVAGDLALRITLLLAVAAGWSFLWRRRSAAMRHRVWCLAFAGALVLPLLPLALPQLSILPAWPSWTRAALSLEAGPPTALEPAESLARRSPPVNSDSLAMELTPVAESGLVEGPAGDSITSEDALGDVRPARGAAASAAAVSPTVLAAAAWAVGVLLLVMRMAIAGAARSRVARRARRLDDRDWLSEIRRLSAKLRLRRRTALIMSPEPLVPMTWGVLRPVLILPENAHGWPLHRRRAVLLHELAHIKRWDVAWQLAARLACAVYWFHPLAWYGLRRMRIERELACDDCVLESGEKASDYAAELLAIAASLRTPRLVFAMPMAQRTGLESRIRAVLDPARPRAAVTRRAGLTLAFLVALVALPLAVVRSSAELVEAPQADERNEDAAGPGEAAGEEREEPAAQRPPAARIPNPVDGRVLGPDGRPLPGADIQVAIVRHDPFRQLQKGVFARTKSDADGRFRLPTIEASPAGDEFYLVASATGYGPAWLRNVELLEQREPVLRLTKDLPIRGRIVNLEGSPVAGATVRVRQVLAARSDQALDDWLAAARKQPFTGRLDDLVAFNDPRGPQPFPAQWNHGRLPSGALPEAVETDERGEFVFHGIGESRLALLEISGKSITKSIRQVIVRDMKAVNARPYLPEQGDIVYHGAQATLVSGFAQPIVGVVRDATTGGPLEDVSVEVKRLRGTPFALRGFLTATTDEQGRFEILGAPQGGGHVLGIDAGLDRPYFAKEVDVASVSGLEPVRADIEMRRGVWISGRLLDHQQQPVPGSLVQYLPLRINKNAESYDNYNPAITGHVPNDRFKTDAEGKFRVLGIAGQGLLMARANQARENDFLSDIPDDVRPFVQENGYLNAYHPFSADYFHALRLVDISIGEKQVECNLALKQALTCLVKIVDANSQPLSGAQVLGRTHPGYQLEKPLDGAELSIVGLSPDLERVVAVMHTEKRLGRVIRVTGQQDEVTVALAPCTTVRGRILDDNGDPAVGVRTTVGIIHADIYGRTLASVETGQDGRFDVLVPAGIECIVWAYSKSGPNFRARVAADGEGAEIDLGDIEDGAQFDFTKENA